MWRWFREKRRQAVRSDEAQAREPSSCCIPILKSLKFWTTSRLTLTAQIPLNGFVFSLYVKLANIQEEVGTFIGVTIDSNGPLENDRFKQLLVTVTAFCPITNMHVKGQKGTRTDILAGDISETLNWNRSLGMFRLKLVNEQEGVMSAQQYYFRTLQFTAIRGNDLKNGQANIH